MLYIVMLRAVLLTAFPLFYTRAIKLTRKSKLLRTADIIKIFRLPKNFDYVEDIMSTAWFRALRLLFAMILVSHWSGCLFHYIAQLKVETKHTWLHACELAMEDNNQRLCYFLPYSVAGIFWLTYLIKQKFYTNCELSFP